MGNQYLKRKLDLLAFLKWCTQLQLWRVRTGFQPVHYCSTIILTHIRPPPANTSCSSPVCSTQSRSCSATHRHPLWPDHQAEPPQQDGKVQRRGALRRVPQAQGCPPRVSRHAVPQPAPPTTPRAWPTLCSLLPLTPPRDTKPRFLHLLDGSTVVVCWTAPARADLGREVLVPRGEEAEAPLEAQTEAGPANTPPDPVCKEDRNLGAVC